MQGEAGCEDAACSVQGVTFTLTLTLSFTHPLTPTTSLISHPSFNPHLSSISVSLINTIPHIGSSHLILSRHTYPRCLDPIYCTRTLTPTRIPDPHSHTHLRRPTGQFTPTPPCTLTWPSSPCAPSGHDLLSTRLTPHLLVWMTQTTI